MSTYAHIAMDGCACVLDGVKNMGHKLADKGVSRSRIYEWRWGGRRRGMVVLEGVDGGKVTHPPLWQLCLPHMVLVVLVQAHALF